MNDLAKHVKVSYKKGKKDMQQPKLLAQIYNTRPYN
jgi:hypothetical protein